MTVGKDNAQGKEGAAEDALDVEKCMTQLGAFGRVCLHINLSSRGL